MQRMPFGEILAEKTRAASGWARYRDFYHIAMILDANEPDLGEIFDLVRRKEIRKTISQESMLRNWDIAKQEMGRGADLIVYTKELPEAKILDAIQRLGHFEITKPE